MISLAVVAAFLGLWWRFDGFGLGKTQSAKEAKGIPDLPEGTPYKVYTNEFDVEIEADEYLQHLARTAEPGSTWTDKFGNFRSEHDQQWADLESKSGQIFAQLDEKWRSLEPKLDMLAERSEDAAITLLVDQSGSLRGDAILHLSAALRWYSQQLDERRFHFELLGFTTASWHGGRSRKLWQSSGRPSYPGRLNDLLHVIYKSFDEPLNIENLDTMLHPQLLKENVDGEAMAWAAERLKQRSEPLKIMIVISDGAPVDDATWSANGHRYMERHFKTVRDEIVSNGEIALGGVGIGYDVDRYYKISTGSNDLTRIPEMITDVWSHLSKSPE